MLPWAIASFFLRAERANVLRREHCPEAYSPPRGPPGLNSARGLRADVKGHRTSAPRASCRHSRHSAVNAADVAIYDGPLEEAFFALISPYDWSEEHYEAFFFEELPDGEKIHNHLCHIQEDFLCTQQTQRNQTQTTKTDTDPAALLFLREAKRLGKKRQREQLQVHQEQHQDTQQRKRTRTRQRRTPLLMPMDASSASDKKRKVIEGESSPRGLKRMRFG